MKPEIQARFNDALTYDARMGSVFSGYESLHLTILSTLSTKLDANAHVLDVGCGTGTTLMTFAKYKPNWTLIGVDPAETMLELARAKINEQGLSERIELHRGTVDDLAPGALFDAASLILVEHLLPDDGAKLSLLKGIAQHLKSGGWFALVSLHGDFATSETQLALAAWQAYMAFQGFPENARQAFAHRATVEDSLAPESRIRELLSEAGFDRTEQFYKVHLIGGWLCQKSIKHTL